MSVIQIRQDKAIKTMDHQKGDLPRMLKETMEELRVCKEKTREMREQHAQDQKLLKATHEEMVDLRRKLIIQDEAIRQKKIDPVKIQTKKDKREHTMEYLTKKLKVSRCRGRDLRFVGKGEG